MIVQHLSEVNLNQSQHDELLLITSKKWIPKPRESILSDDPCSESGHSKFKHQKIEQLVDLFAVPDQVAPTFQRILFDRLVNNFKNNGEENLVPPELKSTLSKVQSLIGEEHLINSQVMIKD